MNPQEESLQRAALTSAHQDFNKSLSSYASFRVSNQATGEGLVQDTFIKTWMYLVKGGKIVVMKSFLYHILNNLIVDEYRKGKHKTSSLDTLLENGFEPSDNNSERVVNLLDGEKALTLIDRLPVVYRNVVSMRYVKDFSLQEISQITGQSRNTISVQLNRGVEKLKLLYHPV